MSIVVKVQPTDENGGAAGFADAPERSHRRVWRVRIAFRSV